MNKPNKFVDTITKNKFVEMLFTIEPNTAKNFGLVPLQDQQGNLIGYAIRVNADNPDVSDKQLITKAKNYLTDVFAKPSKIVFHFESVENHTKANLLTSDVHIEESKFEDESEI